MQRLTKCSQGTLRTRRSPQPGPRTRRRCCLPHLALLRGSPPLKAWAGGACPRALPEASPHPRPSLGVTVASWAAADGLADAPAPPRSGMAPYVALQLRTRHCGALQTEGLRLTLPQFAELRAAVAGVSREMALAQ